MRNVLIVLLFLALLMAPVVVVGAIEGCPGGVCQRVLAPAPSCPGGVCRVQERPAVVATTAPAAAGEVEGRLFDPGLRWRLYLGRTTKRVMRQNPGASPEEIKNLVLEKARRDTVAANPRQSPDEILAWLEKLIPLILMIIQMFSL